MRCKAMREDDGLGLGAYLSARLLSLLSQPWGKGCDSRQLHDSFLLVSMAVPLVWPPQDMQLYEGTCLEKQSCEPGLMPASLS